MNSTICIYVVGAVIFLCLGWIAMELHEIHLAINEQGKRQQ